MHVSQHCIGDVGDRFSPKDVLVFHDFFQALWTSSLGLIREWLVPNVLHLTNGITCAAMSGNLTLQACRVRTRSCLYFPVSSCSPAFSVLVTSFFSTRTIWKEIEAHDILCYYWQNCLPKCMMMWSLRRNCNTNQKLACLALHLKIVNTFILQNDVCMHLEANCPRHSKMTLEFQ